MVESKIIPLTPPRLCGCLCENVGKHFLYPGDENAKRSNLGALKFGGQVNSASQSDRNTSISKGKKMDPDKDSRKLGRVAPNGRKHEI